MKKKDLIKKWLDHEPLTQTQSKAFKKLDAYDSYAKISETAQKFKAPAYDAQQELLDLNNNISNQTKSQISAKSSTIHYFLRIAAIVVMSIGTYFAIFYSNSEKITTLASQKTSVELPDQSMVTLNSRSSITYKKKKWNKHRKIKLNGEAYFKVAKGKTFDVHTASGIISVLGTEFNVKQRKDYFEVTCYEGLVSVSHKNKTIRLAPGKIFRVLQNKTQDIKTLAKTPEWMQNRSVFSSTPYTYILKEFERQYNVTITAKNIDLNKLFTGNFVHSNIQTALQSITIPMRLKYEINDNNITLNKE